ncbi:NF038129 family PEP-CTERM protein [Geomesophilobacter sediminis]|uniref:NF038129 family PEP-CTERM protein n=1 Tax=Geomesophilobacter sediminis TaxID=2798584 RepID=A0A8J7M0A9_9BACT|nr:NF038129 family PEP-CTERM protein [Geomesophilobacter sediminis]MBJ6724227.1 NF038129 family PEP-CTERM protein [Geomesophilobacter sediminis]
MNFLKIKLLTVAALLCASTSAFASYEIDFDVNTTSLAATGGYIDLQYNNGLSATLANASVLNFSTDGALVGSPMTVGSVTGSLPTTVSFTNAGGMNDYFHQMTFGNNVHFHLTVDQVAGNSFGLSFYGADGLTPLLTSDPNGYAAIADITASGLNLTVNSAQVAASQTPIPAAAWLLGSGLMGLAGIRRRKNG